MVTEMKSKLVYREVLKEDLVIIRFVPEKGMPEYRTGQFLTIGLPIPAEKKIVRRAYSIASNAENRDYFEFVIRWVRKPLPGRVTTELFYLSVGDEALLGDPTGAALQDLLLAPLYKRALTSSQLPYKIFYATLDKYFSLLICFKKFDFCYKK